MSYQRTQSRNLVSQQNQSVVPSNDVPRARFIQQWNRKTTGNAGFIYPFCVLEVLPGDHIRLKAEPFVRTATPLFPVMDTQRLDIHWFYVPLRILWDNFERFMGWQRQAGDSIAFTVPQVTSTGNGFALNGLGDHLGLPAVGQPTAQISASAFGFRAYEFIWQEFFRDQNLTLTLPTEAVMFGDATVAENQFVIRNRAKSHDYFTSALIAPQKFTAPVVQSPVIGLGVETGISTTAAGVGATETPSPAYPTGIRTYPFAYESTNDKFILQAFTTNGSPQLFSQTDIRTFRAAMLVQQYLEKDARGGTRYVERNLNHFKVRSPDSRLQRPEFIGGGSTPIVFTPIAQTATGGSGVGALGGAGSALGNGTASYAAVEDGLILGLWSVKSQLSYSQGMPRWASRSVRTDYYVPSLAQLSEQVVFTKEIYCTGVPANDDSVFGYQEPWQELRQRVSEVTGMFRPRAVGTLAQWHLSQDFSAAPVLGPTFIYDSPPLSRVFPTGASNIYYLLDINISGDFTRPMPLFGIPAQLGRF